MRARSVLTAATVLLAALSPGCYVDLGVQWVPVLGGTFRHDETTRTASELGVDANLIQFSVVSVLKDPVTAGGFLGAGTGIICGEFAVGNGLNFGSAALPFCSLVWSKALAEDLQLTGTATLQLSTVYVNEWDFDAGGGPAVVGAALEYGLGSSELYLGAATCLILARLGEVDGGYRYYLNEKTRATAFIHHRHLGTDGDDQEASMTWLALGVSYKFIVE